MKNRIKLNVLLLISFLSSGVSNAHVYTIGEFSSLIEYAWPTFEESNSIYMGRMKDEDILYVNLHNISFIDVISVYKEIENGHSLLLDMSDIELNEKRVIMSQQLIKFGLDAPLIAFNKKNTDSSFYNISVSMEDKKNVIRKSIAYVVSKISKAGEENE